MNQTTAEARTLC